MTTEFDPPLLGHWRHGNGVICCGSMRIAHEDFDTDPAREFADEVLDWACNTLNAAVEAKRNNNTSKGAKDVLAERQRQMSVEGWTPEHDAQHTRHELTNAAICYAANATFRNRLTHKERPLTWPETWDMRFWKPKTPRQDLVRAAALLIAEIDRIDAAA